MPDVSIDGVSVVIRGAFAPAIFSPAWLLHHGVIGQDDFDASDVNIITSDVASFTSGWLSLTVNQDSLSVTSDQVDSFESVRDAAIALLKILPDSGPRALGINRNTHFPVASKEQWHAVGDLLAPKGPWEDIVPLPGMRNVTILAARTDLYAGAVTIGVEPSLKLPIGVYVAQNSHFALQRVARQPVSRDEVVDPSLPLENDSVSGRFEMTLEILSGQWESVFQQSQEILDRLMHVSTGG